MVGSRDGEFFSDGADDNSAGGAFHNSHDDKRQVRGRSSDGGGHGADRTVRDSISCVRCHKAHHKEGHCA